MTKRSRGMALWVALLPFLLSSLIAVGVMPGRSADGLITMVICTGDGMTEMLIDPVTLQPASQTDPNDDGYPGPGHCLWAASHAAFSPAPVFALTRPERRAVPHPAPCPVTVRAAACATGLPPATGPPRTI